jgi:MYXO-CTERM domain-containing protein
VQSKPLRLLTAFCAAAIATIPAVGYDFIREDGRIVKWTGGTVTFQVKTGSTPTLQDGSNYSTSFIAAMNDWNAVIGTLQFAGNISTEAPPTTNGNGINEAFFAANVYGEAFGEDTIAVTTSYRSGAVQSDGTYRRLQSDIVFNNSRTWNSYRGRTQAGVIDFRRVALHELGHVLGLDHPNQATPPQTVSAIMNSLVSSIDALQQDDIAGAQELYGSAGSVTRPGNNDFANAVAVTLNNNAATVTGSNINANKQTGEPNHAPDEPGGASVWWRWTAPSDGSLVLTTAGSNFDTLLAVYTGSAVNALTQIAANDDVQSGVIRTSTLTFNVTGGTVYSIAVDGWEGEWGSITLNLNLAPTNNATAPTISSQPQSTTVTEGGNAMFSVTAAGIPLPTYQWSKGGTAIAGATTATLSLTNVRASDAGTYTVTVSNSAGSVTSNPATLTVNPAATAPTITTQPASQTVTAGASVTFSVVATGTPTPTYQWSKAGTAINGATNASYSVASTTAADAGSYTVTVSNSAGSVTSNAATLTVNPVVVTPPPSSGGGGGGGGAPSHWFFAALALAALARWRQRRQ